MAAASDSEVCWQDIFLSTSRVLSHVETADTNPDLNYHEAALLLNRLETCVCILISFNQELTLQNNQDSRTDSNDFLVLQEITTLMNQVHHYWCQKLIFVRRNTVSLPFINVSQTMHSAGPGRPSFIIAKEIIELYAHQGFIHGQKSVECFVFHVGHYTGEQENTTCRTLEDIQPSQTRSLIH